MIITVSGGVSGVGKTTLITHLIKFFPQCAVVKFTVQDGDGLPFVTTDPAIINEPGKDTAQFAAAGAKPVVWACTSRHALADTVPQALALVQNTAWLVIEGNSAGQLVHSDFAICVLGSDGRFKPSAHAALASADLVLVNCREPFVSERRDVLEQDLQGLVNPSVHLRRLDFIAAADAEWQQIAELIKRNLHQHNY